MGEGKGWEAHVSISRKPVNPAGEYIQAKLGKGNEQKQQTSQPTISLGLSCHL